jgi:mono/diheme cytochrome c family protein
LGLGEQTWQGACAPCHGDKGQGLIGPPLAGRALDPEQVRTIVTTGRGAMPAVGKGWDDTQLNALIAYVTQQIGQRTPGGG